MDAHQEWRDGHILFLVDTSYKVVVASHKVVPYAELPTCMDEPGLQQQEGGKTHVVASLSIPESRAIQGKLEL